MTNKSSEIDPKQEAKHSKAPFTFTDNTVVARFETSDRDTDCGGGHDIDMALLDSAGELVGYSLHQGSNEAATLTSPASGRLSGLPDRLRRQWRIDRRHLVVGSGEPGRQWGRLSMSTPSKVYAGGAATVGVSWSGLTLDEAVPLVSPVQPGQRRERRRSRALLHAMGLHSDTCLISPARSTL